MNDDQSFYEIQLNTPHLVATFLGAAAVGVAIFWLGVVVGRGQGEAGVPTDWQAAVPAEGSGSEEGFGFYDAVEEPTGGHAPQTAEPATQTPAAEESRSAAPDFGAAAQPATTEPAPVAEEPAATPPAARPAASSPPPSSSSMPEPDPSLASGWIVQVRSTTDKPDADSLQSALARAGFPAFVVSAEVNGQTWYRVRVGRYGSRDDASTIESRLQSRSDIEQTWVTEG